MDKDDLELASKMPPECRNEVQEQMAQAYAGIQALSAAVGKNDNARALIASKLLLSLCKGETPDPDLVAELERITAVMEGAPDEVKTLILG